MVTARVNITTGAPSTNFITYVDLVSQNQANNTSTCYYYVQAINRGGTGSFSNFQGSQTATVAGAGGAGHSGTMPSGVGTGDQRWMDGPYGVTLAHNATGYRNPDTVVQSIRGWFNLDDSGSGPSYPRIPIPASAPGTPKASKITPTSVQLDWAASSDNGGSAIDGYLVRRWTGSSMSGTYKDISETNTLTRTDTSLAIGTTYTYAIYAHNGSSDGYSAHSNPVTITTIDNPSAPGTPVASKIMPTTVQLDWSATTDNGGAAIDGYLVRRWTGASMSGTSTDISTSNTLTRTDSKLIPGTQYTYAVYSRNTFGLFSPASKPVTIKTLGPIHVKVSGTWKYAIPYVKVNGVWKMAQPYVKVAGKWKQTG